MAVVDVVGFHVSEPLLAMVPLMFTPLELVNVYPVSTWAARAVPFLVADTPWLYLSVARLPMLEASVAYEASDAVVTPLLVMADATDDFPSLTDFFNASILSFMVLMLLSFVDTLLPRLVRLLFVVSQLTKYGIMIQNTKITAIG